MAAERHLRAYIVAFAEKAPPVPEGCEVVFQATQHDTPLSALEVRKLAILLGRLADTLERNMALETDLQAFTMVVGGA